MTVNVRSVFKAHPFHLVSHTPWPLFSSLSLFSITTTGVMFIHEFSYASYFFFTSLISVVYSMVLCFSYMVVTYSANQTLAVQKCLNMAIGLSYIFTNIIIYKYGFAPICLMNFIYSFLVYIIWYKDLLFITYNYAKKWIYRLSGYKKTTTTNNILIISATLLLVLLLMDDSYSLTIKSKQIITWIYLFCMVYLCIHNLLNSTQEETHLDYLICVLRNPYCFINFFYYGFIIWSILLSVLLLSLNICYSLACSLYFIDYSPFFSSLSEITPLLFTIDSYLLTNNQFEDIYLINEDSTRDSSLLFSYFFENSLVFFNLDYYFIINNQFEEIYSINMDSTGLGGIGVSGLIGGEEGSSPVGGGPPSGGDGLILPLDLSARNDDNSSYQKYAWWYDIFDNRVMLQGLPFRLEDPFNGILNLGPEVELNPVTNYWLSFHESSYLSNLRLDSNSELYNTNLYTNSAPFGLYPSYNLNTLASMDGWILGKKMKILVDLHREGVYQIDVEMPYFTRLSEDIYSRVRNLYHLYVWYAEHNNLRPGLNPMLFQHIIDFIERNNARSWRVIPNSDPTEFDEIVINVNAFWELIYGQSLRNILTVEASSFNPNCLGQVEYVRDTISHINVTYFREYIPNHLRNIPQVLSPGDVSTTSSSEMAMLIEPLAYEYSLQKYYEQVISYYEPNYIDRYSRPPFSVSSSPILREVYSGGNPFAGNLR